jgi:hypothetical protein
MYSVEHAARLRTLDAKKGRNVPSERLDFSNDDMHRDATTKECLRPLGYVDHVFSVH